MFFVVRLNDSFNFPLGLIKCIVIVVIVITSIQHAISFTRKVYALVYLHSTCNQFHPYSAPRVGAGV